MIDIDINKVKELALKAGGDEWEYRKISGEHQVIRKGTLEKCQGYRTFQPVTNELDDIDIAKFIASASPSLVSRLIERLEAAERERDEMKERLSLVRDQRDTELNKNTQLEAEIAQRDAAASEPVAWVCGDDEIRDFKSGREVTIVRDCDDSDLEYLPLYTAAPPAVLPPKLSMDIDPELQGEFRVHEAIRRKGFNQALDAALELGAQPQKPVVLPEPHAHLIWIQAGRGPDDYWDDVEVSRSDKDRCCDGSERYAVYSEFEVKAMLDAANVKWEVKK